MFTEKNDQRAIAASGSTITGPTGTTLAVGPFYNDHFRAMRIGLQVEAESGTTPALAWGLEFKNPANNTWFSLLDMAGAQIVGVPFAAAAVGLRYLDIDSNILSEEDATTQIFTYGTNYKKYGNVFIPFELRLVLTLTGGGGTLQKTYNAFVGGQA
jgi:hypothetical protein